MRGLSLSNLNSSDVSVALLYILYIYDAFLVATRNLELSICIMSSVDMEPGMCALRKTSAIASYCARPLEVQVQSLWSV